MLNRLFLAAVSLALVGCTQTRPLALDDIARDSERTLAAISAMEHRIVHEGLTDDEQNQALKNASMYRQSVIAMDKVIDEIATTPMSPDFTDRFESQLRTWHRHLQTRLEQPAQVFAEAEFDQEAFDQWLAQVESTRESAEGLR
ncbi:MAG: hypothetical protein AAFN41_11130 [Planctomycetota bacterium]